MPCRDCSLCSLQNCSADPAAVEEHESASERKGPVGGLGYYQLRTDQSRSSDAPGAVATAAAARCYRDECQGSSKEWLLELELVVEEWD